MKRNSLVLLLLMAATVSFASVVPTDKKKVIKLEQQPMSIIEAKKLGMVDKKEPKVVQNKESVDYEKEEFDKPQPAIRTSNQAQFRSDEMLKPDTY